MSGPAVRAVIRHPNLWFTAASAAIGLAPRGWWRHAPFVPLPDPAWLKFRLETAYGGDGNSTLRPDDLITWLQWKKAQ